MIITTPLNHKLKHIKLAKRIAKELGFPFVNRGEKSIDKLLFRASRMGFKGVIIISRGHRGKSKAIILMGYPLSSSEIIEGEEKEIAQRIREKIRKELGGEYENI